MGVSYMFVRSPQFWLPVAYSLYRNLTSKVQREAKLPLREAQGSWSQERKKGLPKAQNTIKS